MTIYVRHGFGRVLAEEFQALKVKRAALVEDKPAQVNLPAGPAILTVLSIRNPTQAELDRLLTAIKPPEIESRE